MIHLDLRAHSSEGPEPAYQKIVSGYELFHHDKTFQLKHNHRSLSQFQLAYETWGTLNEKKNNAVLIFTGLSASSHAKSHEVKEFDNWTIHFFLTVEKSSTWLVGTNDRT